VPDIPRLAWPVTLTARGRLEVVAQDSDEDITQCLRAILSTRLDDRVDVPEMGVPDLTFGESPIDTDAVREVLDRHEPRAAVLLQAAPDAVDSLVADLAVDSAADRSR